MNRVSTIILISYAMIFAPSCNTTSRNSNSELNSKKSKTSESLSKDQKSALEDARKEILALIQKNDIVAQDSKGNILSVNNFFEALGSAENDLYLVDNSSFESSKVMMQLKMNTGLIGSDKKFVALNEETQPTHFSYTASMWERNADKSKGAYIATSRQYSRISTDKNKNVANMKGAISSLVADLTEQSKSGVPNTLVKVFNVVIVVLVTVLVAAIVVGYLTAKFGPKSGTGGWFTGYMVGGSIVVGAASTALIIVSAIINGLARMRNGVPPEKALPDFNL